MNPRATFIKGPLLTAVALLLFSYPALCDDKPKPVAKPKAPDKSNSKPAGGGGTASHSTGPTTAAHGPTTSSPHGPTTSSPHGPTTSSPRTTTASQHAATTSPASTAGRGSAASGEKTHTQPAANHTVARTPNGGTVEKRADGKVATLHDPKRGMDVHHTLSGNRRVVVERGDHSRIVAERGGRGYVQRPYMYHGHEYASRSYYYNGRYYNNYYGRYYYRGVYVNPYYPAYYYPPAYYGWAYNPWPAPAPYAWGWGGNPWYGYYGAYFTPYPTYASPSLWLTDYVIAASLQASYQAQVAEAQAAALSNPAPLTPETKQLISDEVRQQIALENSEAKNTSQQNAEPDPASSSIQRALTDGKPHVFVAGQDLDVVDTAGVECALSEGDAIQLTGPTAPDAQTANLSVLASKGGKECQRGATVSVSLTDLQDMQNHMRETIDLGMKELQAKQGQGGLPAAPSAAKAAPVESQMALNAPPPPPEKEVASQIAEQSREADKAEKEVGGEAASVPAPAAVPTAEVKEGQTPDQVIAALGEPLKKATVGAKQIYTYKDIKVTFVNGAVKDVQ
jgi:hypothetical protein